MKMVVERSITLSRFCLACALVGLSSLGGCKGAEDFFKTDSNRFLGPTSNIKAPDRSPINPIFQSVGFVDPYKDLPPNATFPNDDDLSYTDKDYVLGPTDVVAVSVLDLYAEGMETTLQRQVENTGFIDLPLLEHRVQAEGKTKEELKKAVADAYRDAEILPDAIVSVTILARRQSTFSILGGVLRPGGPYVISRKDMRLLEALANAGGVTWSKLRYIYVIRPSPATRIRAEEPGGPGATEPAAIPQIPPLPGAPGGLDLNSALEELGKAMPGAAPSRPGTTQPTPSAMPQFSETASETGGPRSAGPGPRSPTTSAKPRYAYGPNGWIQVAQNVEAATIPQPGSAPVTAAPAAEDPFGWKKMEKADQARIIAINFPNLRNGDPRMNIIVRDNDVIHVPTVEVGEFYVMGEVLRPGAYSLTGRQVNVKQALAAAVGFSPLAWPKNSILIRRVGENQEITQPLDIEAILRGEQPDIFLKPDDVIAVGTNIRAPFYAVVRNAFRVSYGFGFIYDRNFASGTYGLNSDRFKRW